MSFPDADGKVGGGRLRGLVSHILHAYSVTVRKKHSQQSLLLGNFDEAGADLLMELTEFFKNPKMKDWRAADINAAARIGDVYEPSEKEPDTVAVIVKSGETGLASDFVETTDEGLLDDVAFQRGRNHAELVRVLILAKLPGTKDRGLLISHSPAGRGLKTKFWDRFREWFSQRHPEYVVDLNRTAPTGFYKKLIAEQDLKKITLTRLVKPQDMIDDDTRWLDETVLGRMTTTLQPAGRLKRLRKKELTKLLEDEGADISSLLMFHGEEYDEIRTTFKDKTGKEHSIVLGENRTPRAGYDVTEQIDYDDAGHPTYESLRAAAIGYISLLTSS